MLRTDKPPTHAPMPRHHVADNDTLPGYSLPWHKLRTLYQSSGLQAVYDCLLAGATKSGLNGYVACAADYGMRGLIDTDAQTAAQLRQVSTTGAGSMRAVFTALLETCLDNSLLASFTLQVARVGKDRRSGMPPELAESMHYLVRSRLGQSRQGMPEATWLSYVVTSVAALCWQALHMTGDRGIARADVFSRFHQEDTARQEAATNYRMGWHKLESSQPEKTRHTSKGQWRRK